MLHLLKRTPTWAIDEESTAKQSKRVGKTGNFKRTRKETDLCYSASCIVTFFSPAKNPTGQLQKYKNPPNPEEPIISNSLHSHPRSFKLAGTRFKLIWGAANGG